MPWEVISPTKELTYTHTKKDEGNDYLINNSIFHSFIWAKIFWSSNIFFNLLYWLTQMSWIHTNLLAHTTPQSTLSGYWVHQKKPTQVHFHYSKQNRWWYHIADFKTSRENTHKLCSEILHSPRLSFFDDFQVFEDDSKSHLVSGLMGNLTLVGHPYQKESKTLWLEF